MKKEFYHAHFPKLVKVDAEKVINTLASMTYKGERALDYYTRKTASRNIAIECGEYTLYVGEPLARGNKKIDARCLISKLLPVATCPNCESCMHKCYALKAVYAYPTNFFKELIYTYLATVAPEAYADLVIAQIKESKKGVEYVRIHEAGDFFSMSYARAMKRVFDSLPDVHFFTYTKTTFSRVFASCSNFNIVESMISFRGRMVVNFAPVEALEAMAEELQFPICPCGHVDGAHKCMKDCTLCAHCKHVLFIEH